MPVTMRRIADLAGVSVMTVSRALKDNPRLSLATRKRVRRIAGELGYKPHPYVSALMSGLARTQSRKSSVNLAVFCFTGLEEARRHTYHQGIHDRARSLGYTPEDFHYDPGQMPSARLRGILVSRGIRGIILMPAREGFTSLDFDFGGFAAVALGHTISHPPLPRVAGDIYNGTFHAFDELTRRGYRRIGMINTEYVNRLGNFLYSAATLTYRRHVSPSLHLVEHIVEAPILSKASLHKMKRWILRETLDAIVCPAFDFPLYDILRDQGFDIPGRLAYLHLLDHGNPRVSCLSHLGELMGAKAVDLVTAMINRNEFATPKYPEIVGLPAGWHEGETAPSLPAVATIAPLPTHHPLPPLPRHPAVGT